MTQLNEKMLNRAISRAVQEKEYTCKNEVLMSRARLRFQLETNELLQQTKIAIEKKQATLTQIGYKAIKEYLNTFIGAYTVKNEPKKEENAENSANDVK